CYDIDSQHWESVQKPPRQLDYYSACASTDGFIVSGGRLNGIPKSDCYSYNAQNGQWNTLPSMSTARRSHSSIYHNHCLYVVGGGTNDSDPSNSVESLNMRSLRWSHLSPLSHPAYTPYLAVASDNLFALGSSDGKWGVDVHGFDFTQQTWRQRSPMPEKCIDGAAVSFNDHVYVVGG
ncbi:hypothetical protein CAPTEDRAFT_37270, partial [Capitella teleta]